MSTSMSGSRGMGSPTGRAAMSSPTGIQKNKIPRGYGEGQIAQYTPEQMQLFQQLFSNVSPDSYLGRLAGGDEDVFNEIEAPALRQFSGLQGNLASRFSGFGGKGSLGARNSSGFQNTATQAASNFAQDLQSRRQALQQQAIRELHGMGQDLLNQRPYDRFIAEKPLTYGQQLGLTGVKAVGNIASSAAHAYAGGY